jgi:hypothetical protein
VEGKPSRMAWMVSVDQPKLYWYFNFIRLMRSQECYAEFSDRLKAIFGTDVDPARPEQYHSFDSIQSHRQNSKS